MKILKPLEDLLRQCKEVNENKKNKFKENLIRQLKDLRKQDRNNLLVILKQKRVKHKNRSETNRDVSNMDAGWNRALDSLVADIYKYYKETNEKMG